MPKLGQFLANTYTSRRPVVFDGGTAVSFVGVEVSTGGPEGNDYAAQNWALSNPKLYNTGTAEKYGTSGYVVIRPIQNPTGLQTLGQLALGNNDLGASNAPYNSIALKPSFLKNINGNAGTFVNYGGYPGISVPDGSSGWRLGSLSLTVTEGPYTVKDASNADVTAYVASSVFFQARTQAKFRIGVGIDSVADAAYAADYVGVYNEKTGSKLSTLLAREGSFKLVFFDITALVDDSFTIGLWRVAANQTAAFGLLTVDQIA